MLGSEEERGGGEAGGAGRGQVTWPLWRENRFCSRGVGRKEGGRADRWPRAGLEPRPPGMGSPRGRFMVWAGGTRLDALCRSFHICPAEILLTSHPQVSGLMV